MFSQRPPFDMSDDELKAQARAMAPHAMRGFNDIMRELDRRAAERHARSLSTLTIILVVSTVVYTFATLALVVVTAAKP